jgi:hypothetical protein
MLKGDPNNARGVITPMLLKSLQQHKQLIHICLAAFIGK